MSGSAGPRAYDATERRRLAGQQRRESRRRVVAAATRCFLDAGYFATTIADIARAGEVDHELCPALRQWAERAA